MTPSIPKSALEISSDWLSQLLSIQSTHPVNLHIENIEPGTRWNVAETAFVKVRYGNPSCSLPTSLFIKLRGDADPLSAIFPGEYEFYTTAQDTNLPIAPCLALLQDPGSGTTCLVLEDLSNTHKPAQWPLPPTVQQCYMAVRSLAELHAYWIQPGNDDYLHREKALNKIVDGMLSHFFQSLGDRISTDRIQLLRQVCQRVPSLKATRLQKNKPLTRIHGDAHFWNVLYPEDAKRSSAVLIDFEDWRIDFAGLDLALMMAMHWYPQRRARHEKNVLNEYLAAFNSCNITELSFEELYQEYRFGHICNAVIPIFQHSAGHKHASWWSNLERWFLAFDDLECSDLL